MRKLISTAAVAAAMGLGLAACGGSSPTTTTTAGVTTTTGAATSTTAAATSTTGSASTVGGSASTVGGSASTVSSSPTCTAVKKTLSSIQTNLPKVFTGGNPSQASATIQKYAKQLNTEAANGSGALKSAVNTFISAIQSAAKNPASANIGQLTTDAGNIQSAACS